MGSQKKVLVLIANGTEEMEAVISIDILRRAQIEVLVAGVEVDEFATCNRGVNIKPDLIIKDFSSLDASAYDAIIIPGGLKGAETISSNAGVQSLLSSAYKSGKIIAAICAGPFAIKAAGINKGGKITSYQTFKEELENGYVYVALFFITFKI
ncbi:3492_t:CDS:2 [Acaulospora colombiana]|uniref:3492_t:CDS:1 n=1 Tax=Acaulospora colombiana TaxID=27376 RepID=A0ACA9LIL7_9GLOM|nr:3492_t:CDS:2 [Acaulospora colombiana]